MSAAIVEVRHLRKHFKTRYGSLHAVDDVDFAIDSGKTLGVVGESGCGKSTLGRVIIHLLESTGGKVFFEGRDITVLKRNEIDALRSEMQIVFQDPFSSLNPRMTVSEAISEPLMLIKRMGGARLKDEVRRLMDRVGLAQNLVNSYPHELDGGRRQRIGIARALSVSPKFIVCDEPVSALDVSIQAQILNLMKDLQEERGYTYLFISHNLAVVRYISDEICVMYLGQLVEKCPSDELFENPLHPYTRSLLSAIPTTDIFDKKERIVLKGELASPIDPGPGCRFAPRCMYATEECERPQAFEETGRGHFVMCGKVSKI